MKYNEVKFVSVKHKVQFYYLLKIYYIYITIVNDYSVLYEVYLPAYTLL